MIIAHVIMNRFLIALYPVMFTFIRKETVMSPQKLMGIFFAGILFWNIDTIASPVPDTGQTKCYDNTVEITCPSPGQPFYGQDSNFSINPPSYTKLDGSGNVLPDAATSWSMVKDNVTGLIWEMKTNKDGVPNYSDPHDADNVYTWYDSNPNTNGGNAGTPGSGANTESFIKALNDAKFGGYSDWRLPTDRELAYIVDYSIPYPGPTIDAQYFPNTAASWYWTSTTLSDYTDNAWLVHFDYSYVHAYYKSDSRYVRAVRGGQNNAQTAADSYKDNGDGTVTDTSTGLIWQKTGISGKTWEQALAYCESLNLASHADWRLPNAKELRSLVDATRSNPSISTTYFPDTAASWYWSSTTSAYNTSNAWIVNFYFGDVDGYDKGGSYNVRAVRTEGVPVPDIKVNGQDGSITVTTGAQVSLTASLSPGDQNGKSADWWIVADTPWGPCSFVSYEWNPGIYPFATAPLVSVAPVEIFNGYLPAGDYTFYVGVDLTPDGKIDSPIYYDHVQVHVVN